MDEGLRILRLAGKIHPETLGGIGLHVHQMSKNQVEMGHEVTVLVPDFGDQSLPRNECRDGYSIRRHREISDTLGNSITPGIGKTVWELKDQFDVIHAHSHLFFITNIAAIVRKLDNTPLAITNHGLFSQSAPKSVQKLYLRTIGKWTLNSADLVFCYTEEAESQARSYGISSNIEVVSNGIDEDRFSPGGEMYDRMGTGKKNVLSVIRLVDGKRPQDIIDAIEIVKETHEDVELYLCGDGYLRDELEEYVRTKGLEGHITFFGNVDYEKMPQLYRASDIVVLPSENEAGCPRVILEAMAAGKPFIITDLDQNSSVLKDAGLTAPVGDVRHLAEQIKKLLQDEYIHETIGKRGRELVSDEFNWQKTTEETTAAIEQLVENHNNK